MARDFPTFLPLSTTAFEGPGANARMQWPEGQLGKGTPLCQAHWKAKAPEWIKDGQEIRPTAIYNARMSFFMARQARFVADHFRLQPLAMHTCRTNYGGRTFLYTPENLRKENVRHWQVSQVATKLALAQVSGKTRTTNIGSETIDIQSVMQTRNELGSLVRELVEQEELYMHQNPIEGMLHVTDDAYVNHMFTPFHEFTNEIDLVRISDSTLIFGKGEWNDPSKIYNDRFKEYNNKGWMGGRSCIVYESVNAIVMAGATLRELTAMIKKLVEEDPVAMGDPTKFTKQVVATWSGNELTKTQTTAISIESPQFIDCCCDAQVHAKTVQALPQYSMEGPSTAWLWDIEGFDMCVKIIMSHLRDSGHAFWKMGAGWQRMKEYRQQKKKKIGWHFNKSCQLIQMVCESQVDILTIQHHIQQCWFCIQYEIDRQSFLHQAFEAHKIGGRVVTTPGEYADHYLILSAEEVAAIQKDSEEQQQAVAGRSAAHDPEREVEDLKRFLADLTEDDMEVAVSYMLEMACKQGNMAMFGIGDYFATPQRYCKADPRYRPPCEEYDKLNVPCIYVSTIPNRLRIGPVQEVWAKPIADTHGITVWVSMARIPSYFNSDSGMTAWVVVSHGKRVFLEQVSEDWVHPDVALIAKSGGTSSVGQPTRAEHSPLLCPNSTPDSRFPDDCAEFPAQRGWPPIPHTWSQRDLKNSASGAATQILRCRLDELSPGDNGLDIDRFFHLMKPEMRKRWPWTVPKDVDDMVKQIIAGATRPRYEMKMSSQNESSFLFRRGPVRPLAIRACQGRLYKSCPFTARNCYLVTPKDSPSVWHITQGSNLQGIFKRGLLRGMVNQKNQSGKAEVFVSLVNAWCPEWNTQACPEVSAMGSYDTSLFKHVLRLPYRYAPYGYKHGGDLYAIEFHIPTIYNEGGQVWQFVSLAGSATEDISENAIMQVRCVATDKQTWVRKDPDGNQYIWDPVPRGVKQGDGEGVPEPPIASPTASSSSSLPQHRATYTETQDEKNFDELMNEPSLSSEMWIEATMMQTQAKFKGWQTAELLAAVAKDPKFIKKGEPKHGRIIDVSEAAAQGESALVDCENEFWFVEALIEMQQDYDNQVLKFFKQVQPEQREPATSVGQPTPAPTADRAAKPAASSYSGAAPAPHKGPPPPKPPPELKSSRGSVQQSGVSAAPSKKKNVNKIPDPDVSPPCGQPGAPKLGRYMDALTTKERQDWYATVDALCILKRWQEGRPRNRRGFAEFLIDMQEGKYPAAEAWLREAARCVKEGEEDMAVTSLYEYQKLYEAPRPVPKPKKAASTLQPLGAAKLASHQVPSQSSSSSSQLALCTPPKVSSSSMPTPSGPAEPKAVMEDTSVGQPTAMEAEPVASHQCAEAPPGMAVAKRNYESDYVSLPIIPAPGNQKCDKCQLHYSKRVALCTHCGWMKRDMIISTTSRHHTIHSIPESNVGWQVHEDRGARADARTKGSGAERQKAKHFELRAISDSEEGRYRNMLEKWFHPRPEHVYWKASILRGNPQAVLEGPDNWIRRIYELQAIPQGKGATFAPASKAQRKAAVKDKGKLVILDRAPGDTGRAGDHEDWRKGLAVRDALYPKAPTPVPKDRKPAPWRSPQAAKAVAKPQQPTPGTFSSDYAWRSSSSVGQPTANLGNWHSPDSHYRPHTDPYASSAEHGWSEPPRSRQTQSWQDALWHRGTGWQGEAWTDSSWSCAPTRDDWRDAQDDGQSSQSSGQHAPWRRMPTPAGRSRSREPERREPPVAAPQRQSSRPPADEQVHQPAYRDIRSPSVGRGRVDLDVPKSGRVHVSTAKAKPSTPSSSRQWQPRPTSAKKSGQEQRNDPRSGYTWR